MDNLGLNHNRIIKEFRTSTNFGDYPVNNDNPQWNKTRIVKVRLCPSFVAGYEHITTYHFLQFFDSLPNAFVIVIRCEHGKNQLSLADISAVLRQRFFDFNRPILIFFESPNSWRIIYKNYGINQEFMEVVEPMDVEAQHVEDFSSLMVNLQNGGYGFFNGYLMETTLNVSANPENIEPNSIEDLMETFADRNDFLCVRFLHLFRRDLRPNIRTIQRIIRDDFLNNNADRFAAIYGHDFKVAIPDGYNLLMLAIAHRNADAAEILIRSRINLNVTVDHLNAADLACATGQFNILSTLIRFNSQYPHNFNLQNAHLAEIGDIQLRTRLIHDQIMDVDEQNDFETSKDIIVGAASIFPNLKYWYDLTNQSAVTKAILRRKFRTYQLLLEIGLCLGPYEDVAAIREGLSELEQQRLTFINAEIAQNLQRDYLLTLRTNSFDWQHNPDLETQTDKIDEAFKILNENEFIQPILQIVAASRDFRIIFDFNRTSVEAVDFTSHRQTEGVFQTVLAMNFHIYIGAHDLLNEHTKLRTIGTLAHELCHCAMLLTYNNRCKPYERGNGEARNAFDVITRRCLAISRNGNAIEQEEIVALVSNYNQAKHHAEMIVRAPHMMMLYQESPRLQQVQTTYNDLFTDFTVRVIPNIMSRITQVRDNFYEWIRLEHTYWAKKAKKEKIIRYSLVSTVVLAICIVIGLGFVINNLNGCKTDPNNDCTWEMLNEREKEEILDTTVNYQGHNRTLRDITNGNYEILKRLTNKEVRNPKQIEINRQNWKLEFDYFKRKFTYFDDSYSHIDYLVEDDPCDYRYAYELSIDGIQRSINNRTFYIIAGEPLSGKSTELLKIAENVTQSNQLAWVSYLNFSSIKIENYVGFANWTVGNLTNFLSAAKGIDINSFESEIFKRNFEIGDVILFIDHIDKLFIKNEEFAERFLKVLIEKSHDNAELWFGTRSWYSNKIEEIIKNFDSGFTSKYKLLPLYCQDRDDYLLKILRTTTLNLSQINSTLSRINEILEPLEGWRNMKTTKIDNIYILKVIANHTAMPMLKNESSINIYEILDGYIRKTADFNTSATNADRDLFGKSVMLHILKFDTGYRLKDVNMSILIDDYSNDHKYYNLPKSNVDILSIADGVIDKQLELGIFKKNYKKIDFLSPIYFEYFVARYIYDEFWMKIKYADEEIVFENKVNLFLSIFWDLKVNFPVVKRCIKDFVKNDGKTVKFNKNFKKIFEKLFVKFTSNTNIQVGESMMELFEDDSDMQNILRR
ncbi:hypothetical protein ACKWTF_015406 [Chironomus riparius]